MLKKYIVTLTGDERKELEEVLKSKICSKEKRIRAYSLLKSAEGWSDKRIGESYRISPSGIERLRKRFVERGFAKTLERKLRETPPRCRKIDGAAEAHLIALCCGDAPAGRSRWTLRLLAKKMVELEIVESIGHESIRRTLKKINLNLG